MKTVLTAISAVALLCTMVTAQAAVTGLRVGDDDIVRWNSVGWHQMQLESSPWTVVCGTNNRSCRAPQKDKWYVVKNLTYGGQDRIFVPDNQVPRPSQCGVSIVSGAGVKGLSVFHDRVSWDRSISGGWIQIQSRNGNRTFWQGNGRTTHILAAFGPYKIIDHGTRGRPVSYFTLARDCRAP